MKSLAILSVAFALIVVGGCGPVEKEASEGSGTAKPVVVNDANFEEVVLNSDKPVLVDFWATWCKPCELIAPIVEELAHEYEGRAVVAKLDIDNARDIAREYNVSSIPTLIVFKNGEEVSRVVGVQEKSVLSGKLDEAIEHLGTSD